jgi:hypothetical protein
VFSYDPQNKHRLFPNRFAFVRVPVNIQREVHFESFDIIQLNFVLHGADSAILSFSPQLWPRRFS